MDESYFWITSSQALIYVTPSPIRIINWLYWSGIREREQRQIQCNLIVTLAAIIKVQTADTISRECLLVYFI